MAAIFAYSCDAKVRKNERTESDVTEFLAFGESCARPPYYAGNWFLKKPTIKRDVTHPCVKVTSLVPVQILIECSIVF